LTAAVNPRMAPRMSPRDGTELVSLAMLWGGSFLFMRMGAAEFGPVALSALRLIGASLLLVPLLLWRGQWQALHQHWRPIFLVGVTNSALPFVCFAYAALSINAGLMAIFNAATPLFAAVIAWWWLKDQLTPLRVAGLVIGFVGVAGLAWEKASFKPGGSGWAVVACVVASMLYGFSANFTKRKLTGVPPLAVAAGSQLGASIFLILPALWLWPAQAPSGNAWLMAGLLAFACTGLAYLMFFRLIANVGPSNAITVTFLVPLFAVLWGRVFLGELLTPAMGIGCLVILLGTGLTTGVLRRRQRPS
jgi:drug/metabolite transporter (DMT)-like permease